MNVPKKCCVYCGRWFQPDPRCVAFQKACPRKRCRHERKKQAQAVLWVRETQDHVILLDGSKELARHKKLTDPAGPFQVTLPGHERKHRRSAPARVPPEDAALKVTPPPDLAAFDEPEPQGPEAGESKDHRPHAGPPEPPPCSTQILLHRLARLDVLVIDELGCAPRGAWNRPACNGWAWPMRGP